MEKSRRAPWRAQDKVDPGGDGQPLQRAFAWVAAGAVALGLSLAVVSGTAVAAADTGSDSGASSSSSSSSDGGTSKSDSDAKGSDSDKPGDTDEETEPDSKSAKADDDDEASTVESDAREHKSKSTAKASADDEDVAAQSGGDISPAESVDTSHQPDSAGAAPVAQTSDAAETVDLTTESARAPPLSLVTADHVAQASPWQTAWEDFVRRLQYTFFNKAPTLDPEDGVQGSNGYVTGQLNGSSNNGYALTYTLTQGPAHGTVTIDQATGKYVYVPSALDTRIRDSFVITADNGVAARLPGLMGSLQAITHSLAQGLGLAKADTVDVTIEVLSWFPNSTAGDPLDAQYWAEQNYNNCVLMSVAMVEGQLTKVLPTDQTEQDIIDLASKTPSVVDPSQMMWTGPDALGVKYRDGAELLRMKGFDVDYRYYSDVEYGFGSYAQGATALVALKQDLAAGKGVLVSVNGKTIWTAERPGFWNGQFFGSANHAIVVLAVDEARGVVWVNDSGLKYLETGKGAAVPLGAFMYAWAAGGYLTVAASVKVPAEQEESQLIAA